MLLVKHERPSDGMYSAHALILAGGSEVED